MSRYIDADALLASVPDEPYKGAVRRLLMQAPTADVAPVVHERCEYCQDGKSFIGAKLLLANNGQWVEIKYCPNCGAKMDGKETGE